MGREIKRFIIGVLVSGGIHCAVFFSSISLTPALDVQEIPGSIEISLGAYQQPPRETISMQEQETKPSRERIEMAEQEPSPQAADRVKTTKVEDDTLSENKPVSRGDSAVAIPQEGNPKPPYPEIARRRGYEGTVKLKVEVLASGKVGSIIVQESSGYEILDRSALETVQDWRFIPARLGGVPVRSTKIFLVTFQLED